MLPIFQWFENTGIGTGVRQSLWLFPATEAVHLLALALIGGAVLLVDLRLLGWGINGKPVAQLARDAYPWLVGSFAVMIITGVVLFLSEAVKCYYNKAFWFKMVALLLATLYTFTIRKRVLEADEDRVGRVRMRLTAIVSLAFWSAVGIGGRGIGFFQ